MAFASSPHKIGSGGMGPRPLVRVEKGGGGHGSSVNSSAGGAKPVTPPSTASPPMRPKSASPSSSMGGTITRRNSGQGGGQKAGTGGDKSGGVPGRVRVAVRLRPRNGEEMVADMDFADCVELQPELKRLKLRKNNWDCETYQFDEVLTETSSQKRVYEVVAKPVVESVCEGFNGTVMAYGQTGTGKTFTLGNLGETDTADRGIMVRALEDILANVNSDSDSVTVSYLQLYMETVQDLLAPEKDNIAIVEDPKTGDVSVPGSTQIDLRDQRSFVELLQAGEANRFAANTKLNTESSRSHAILLVSVKKVVKPKDSLGALALPTAQTPNENGAGIAGIPGAPNQARTKGIVASTVRKSKLLIVDLAGSERVDKSGSEGHTLEEAKSINLSLTALGKCINALAENSPHVPIRDSKLTRMLRDSFGGTARTSLIVTIGPSPRHRGETASTIAFGQRAMKVENMVRLREEFDYKSLCRRLETELDRLVAENERQAKSRAEEADEFEKKVEDAQETAVAAEGRLGAALKAMEVLRREHAEMVEKLERADKELKDIAQDYQHERKERFSHAEKLKLQRDLTDAMMKHQKELADEKQAQVKELADANHRLALERAERERLEAELGEASQHLRRAESGNHEKSNNEVLQLRMSLEYETQLRQKLEQELRALRTPKIPNGVEGGNNNNSNNRDRDRDGEAVVMKGRLEEELKHREILEEELRNLKEQLMVVLSDEGSESRKIIDRVVAGRGNSDASSQGGVHNPGSQMRDTINGQRVTIAKLFEQVGLQKILSLLESEDVDVRVHAVKVVANLAAEEANQEKIVEAGGLGSLLILLQSSEDETIRRVAAGAVANLAMNEINQELIMAQGGIGLLARTADDAEDPQTLRMVAGAIANLCGNDKLQLKLREEGGIRALLGMVRSRHPDVLAQVARGIANFAKCESRGAAQGYKSGRSLLIDDGALPWIVTNANNDASPIRRHIELALCHLAQHEVNSKDLVAGGALWELVRISRECSREDIRHLAQRTLNASTTFQTELKRLQLVPMKSK